MRSLLRALAWLIGGAAVAALVLAGGLQLWLRTGHGHHTVERVLTRILNTRVPGSVSTGRVRGDVITGLRVDDVVIRNPEGAIIARATYVEGRWRPLALLRRRELDQVDVERPIIALDRARWRAPPGPASTRGGTEVIIHEIVASDGQASWRRAVFMRVNGTATLYSSSHLDVHGVVGRAAGNVLHAFGTVGWGRQPAWVASRFAVARTGRFRGRGELFYTRDRLEADIVELTIAAPVATRLIGGHGAAIVSARIEGLPGSLRSMARARQGRRVMRVQAAIDPRRRIASVRARLAGGPRPIRLRVRARERSGTAELSALHASVGASHIDGNGAFARHHLRLSLRVHLLPAEARLFGLEPRAPIDATLALAGPVAALAVQGRARLESAEAAWRGHLDARSRAGALRVLARHVDPQRLLPRAPAIDVSGAIDFAGRVVPHALVGRVHLRSVSAVVRGQSLSDLDGDAHVRLARDGEVRASRVAGTWKRRAFTARGVLRWTARGIALDGADLDFAGAHARADGHYQLADHRFQLRAAPLTLSPALVGKLLHRRAEAWSGNLELQGVRGDVTVNAEVSTRFGPLQVTAQVARAGALVELKRVAARVGDSHLYGAARYQAGRIDASVDELLLAPALVHQLSSSLSPAWPIRMRGALAGRRVLHLSLVVDAGPSTANLSGRIAARRFELAGHLDSFDVAVLRPTKRRVRGTLQLSASGRFAGGGVIGTVKIRDARGYLLDSPFYRGEAVAQLEGRDFKLASARVDIPGARLLGDGSGGLGKRVVIHFGVVIVNALALRKVPEGLRVLVGINSMLPGRSVTGSIIKDPGQKAAVRYRVLPIGLAQLEFLFRMLSGRLPRFETRL